MDLYKLADVATMLGVTTQTVRNMIKRGELKAVFPKTGEMGRPRTMITASSYGAYLLRKRGKKA